MQRLAMLSLLFSVGCWTVQPTAVQKKERLDRALYQAKTFSGERFGGDDAVLLADRFIFTFNDIEWRNAVDLNSLAELNIASSGLGGLSGVLFGGAVGAGILGTTGLPAGDGDENIEVRRLLGFIVGFMIGVPVGIVFGAWLGTRLEEGTTLNFRTMTTSEKIETLKKHLSD